MLLQKEKQSIEEIGKKDKKIYERRKVSLSNIYDLLFPQKSRKYFRTNAKEHIGEVSSVKVSFCTSFRGKIKKGSLGSRNSTCTAADSSWGMVTPDFVYWIYYKTADGNI